MKRLHSLGLALAFCVLAGVIVGCSVNAPPVPPTATTAKAHDDHDDHDDHDKAGMMVAHVGKHHGYLQAHLSKKGENELDLYFETSGTDVKPLALPLAKITGTGRRAGEEKENELVFEPAPAAERPKDEKPGTCSHFVAKAPWMKPDDVLVVSIEVEVDGRLRKPRWTKFIPEKFAHHHD